ncbi:Outer membrane lipoprotein blc precursor [Prosthecochloris sp. CIB 2401]|uniref:Lipocalin family protein n=1 Tax=Prosthecochloris vibrioformis TaxID=1098 RepID=A0A5C4S1J3_PROVB|nr:Outer membrane lipoprotein blc precursor [Prosthecochloris sp. CIB 2401]TNJ37028.1 lipocalin family protein [Prosthecochloris vibrioformis]
MFRKLFTSSKPVTRGPETVAQVDVRKYCGTWYEIASFQPKEQRSCTKTKAEYTLNSAGYVDVRNSCRKKGRERAIRARAYVLPDSGNAKLLVKFFRIIKGDYWIVSLADDYAWAAVSSPAMRSLWILSRTPYMEDSVYEGIVRMLEDKGFDVARLRKTPQGE